MTDYLEKRLQLFPVTTRFETSTMPAHLEIAGCDLEHLAEVYGTPLYLYDLESMQNAVQDYQQALARYYPVQSGLTYAAKAYLCTAIAQWAQQENLILDCTGATELDIARHAQVQTDHILVHGVNKTTQDLHAAIQHAGILVIDNLIELERILQIVRSGATRIPNLWLRYRPGIAVETHHYNQTGQEDSKFGMSAGEVFNAVKICQENKLPLTGLHFHQGSHFHNAEPVAPAIQAALDLLVGLKQSYQWQVEVLCPGGGWGVPYHEDDLPHARIEQYVEFVTSNIIQGCQERGLSLPKLQLEPGRSLVARAGVAIYRVGAIKHTTHTRWILVDGGMADNPRPALYGARYSALPILDPHRSLLGPANIGGPYCESGDILIHDLPMPDIQEEELIAIPVSGAYQLSLASNYNGALKPAVLLLENHHAHLIQARETSEDLYHRDHPLDIS